MYSIWRRLSGNFQYVKDLWNVYCTYKVFESFSNFRTLVEGICSSEDLRSIFSGQMSRGSSLVYIWKTCVK